MVLGSLFACWLHNIIGSWLWLWHIVLMAVRCEIWLINLLNSVPAQKFTDFLLAVSRICDIVWPMSQDRFPLVSIFRMWRKSTCLSWIVINKMGSKRIRFHKNVSDVDKRRSGAAASSAVDVISHFRTPTHRRLVAARFRSLPKFVCSNNSLNTEDAAHSYLDPEWRVFEKTLSQIRIWYQSGGKAINRLGGLVGRLQLPFDGQWRMRLDSWKMRANEIIYLLQVFLSMLVVNYIVQILCLCTDYSQGEVLQATENRLLLRLSRVGTPLFIKPNSSNPSPSSRYTSTAVCIRFISRVNPRVICVSPTIFIDALSFTPLSLQISSPILCWNEIPIRCEREC